MRFARGVVKIPIKILYVFLIVLSTSFFLYLHVLKHQRVRVYHQCRVIPQHHESSTLMGDSENSRKNHSVCWMDPRVTRFEDCPDCFRPNVKNISNQMEKLHYNLTMFPRGPPGLFTLKNEIQQGYIQDYLITPRTVCVDTCPYLLAILLSVSDDVDQRSAIRATWASVAKTRLWPNSNINADMQVLFVLGHKTPDSNIKFNEEQAPKKYVDFEHFPTLKEWAVIKTEADIYGDILYLNMQDSYYNLTLKSLSALKWVDDHCPRVKFVLKVDTDTFVNVPLLLDLLIFNENRLEYSLLGKMYTIERTVLRATKWAVDPQIYPPPIFPIYASGCAYIVSKLALSALVGAYPYFPSFPIEDAFTTGVLARIMRVELMSPPCVLFTDNMDFYWDRCDFVNHLKIAGTGVSFPFKLRNMWAGIVYDDGKCADYNLVTMNCYCTKNELY